MENSKNQSVYADSYARKSQSFKISRYYRKASALKTHCGEISGNEHEERHVEYVNSFKNRVFPEIDMVISLVYKILHCMSQNNQKHQYSLYTVPVFISFVINRYLIHMHLKV